MCDTTVRLLTSVETPIRSLTGDLATSLISIQVCPKNPPCYLRTKQTVETLSSYSDSKCFALSQIDLEAGHLVASATVKLLFLAAIKFSVLTIS